MKITCPYCKLDFHLKRSDLRGRELITCPSDDGGCDLDFVAKWTYTPQVETFKVEGQTYIPKPTFTEDDLPF